MSNPPKKHGADGTKEEEKQNLQNLLCNKQPPDGAKCAAALKPAQETP